MTPLSRFTTHTSRKINSLTKSSHSTKSSSHAFRVWDTNSSLSLVQNRAISTLLSSNTRTLSKCAPQTLNLNALQHVEPRFYSTGVSHQAPPPMNTSSTKAKKVAHNIMSQIREKNYAVLDNVFSQGRYQKLSTEMKQCLKDCAKDWEAGRHVPGEERTAFQKNLRARTIPFPTVAQIIYFFTKDITRTFNTTNMTSESGLHLKSDLASKGEGILTLYTPGSFYSKHLDCVNPEEDGRRISFVYYVTDPDWNMERDGGALRLYPNKANPEEYVDVDPVPNRLVAYFSNQMPNEVLPPKKNRLSLCFWLSEMIEQGSVHTEKSDMSMTQHLY